jgi:hypothetical protein
MTTRNWTCMCGAFEGQVTGDPALAVYCHCGMCRKQTGAAMQLGVWDDLKVLKGEDNLIKYEGAPGVFRNSCKTCGSYCYKILGNGCKVAPLGTLDPVVKPTCHIFVADKGLGDVCFPELPQHDAFP